MYDPRQFLYKLHTKEWHFIRIKRHHVLRQALSNIIANQRGTWQSYSKGLDAQDGYVIDCDYLLNSLHKMSADSILLESALENIPHTKILYEEDLLKPDMHQKTVDRILANLSLPHIPVSAQLIRLSTDDIQTLVRNCSEVARTLKDTQYARLLDN